MDTHWRRTKHLHETNVLSVEYGGSWPPENTNRKVKSSYNRRSSSFEWGWLHFGKEGQLLKKSNWSIPSIDTDLLRTTNIRQSKNKVPPMLRFTKDMTTFTKIALYCIYWRIAKRVNQPQNRPTSCTGGHERAFITSTVVVRFSNSVSHVWMRSTCDVSADASQECKLCCRSGRPGRGRSRCHCSYLLACVTASPCIVARWWGAARCSWRGAMPADSPLCTTLCTGRWPSGSPSVAPATKVPHSRDHFQFQNLVT